MGVVYKAMDTKLKRQVAIKFLPKRLSAHDEERERFIHEAQAASSLNHPAICTIHGIDEVNGETFIVMEYIEGTTLREWVRKNLEQSDGYRKLGLKETVDLAIQIAEGLEQAHDKGIVHRDIKSENVMVTPEGRVKIMDFGLAKLRGVSKVTKTGSTIGTIAYMSPEQVEGMETDHRTDIFSYGVVLYEMFAGRLPFQAAHEAALMYEIINVPPPALSSVRPGVDDELGKIVLKCLEKDREIRYQSMKDIAVDLKRYKRDSAGSPLSRPSGIRPAEPGDRAPAQSGVAARWIKSVLSGVLIVALVAAWWFFFAPKTSPLDSLAVLPFSNGTTDPNAEYLTEGVTENIINKLSQLSKLRVMPRSIVAKYKGKDADPRDVGKDLNVSAVLTGKITQQGDDLVIQTELIDVRNVSQLWGEQYNRKLAELVDVQQDIAEKVAGKLQTQISGEERTTLASHPTVNSEAYQLYLKGQFQTGKRTAEGYLRGIKFFTMAISRDPGFALAYTGLAEAYVVAQTIDMAPKDAMPPTKTAVLKALELDPKLPEAHAALGTVRAYYDYDFPAAEQSFRRSIELNPNYARAHHWYAEFLIYMGRFDEGIAEYKRATELDPASLVIASDFGNGYYVMRQYDKSIEVLRKAIEADPNFVRSHYYIIAPLRKKGMDDEAFRELIAGKTAEGDSVGVIEELKKRYAASGFRGVASYSLGRISGKPAPSLLVIDWLMSAGEKDKALDVLEEAYAQRSPFCATMKTEPAFDGLRGEPRFAAVLKKVGLDK
jgi:serine/threonine protein kinase/tetratricopeptide (TPR) repeat protein